MTTGAMCAEMLELIEANVGDLELARASGERFHSDITYIPTEEGFLFLSATLDAYTRKCAGWCA